MVASVVVGGGIRRSTPTASLPRARNMASFCPVVYFWDRDLALEVAVDVLIIGLALNNACGFGAHYCLPMEDRPAWEREMVRVFLSEHDDAHARFVSYNLRGTAGTNARSAAAPLALGVKSADPQSKWEMAGAIGAVVCTIYFFVTTIVNVMSVLRSAFSSPSWVCPRIYVDELSAHGVLALGGGGWCVRCSLSASAGASALGLDRRTRPRASCWFGAVITCSCMGLEDCFVTERMRLCPPTMN